MAAQPNTSSPTRSRSGKRRPKRTSRSKGKGATAIPQDPVPVTIETLGDRGDGLAVHPDDGQRLYIAGALPGETVEVTPYEAAGSGLRAEVTSILTPSPDRIDPPCPHAGDCGGCSLQVLAEPARTQDKQHRLITALQRHGFTTAELDEVIKPIRIIAGSASRQRLSVGLSPANGGSIGFRPRRGHRILDTTDCLLPGPPLADDLASLRRHWRALCRSDNAHQELDPQDTLTLHLTATETGTDALLAMRNPPALGLRMLLGQWAEDRDLARVTLRVRGLDEPAAWRHDACLTLGGVSVTLPPGPFLQPSAAGQATLQALVLDAAGPARAADNGSRPKAADLFCGLGTFALPLAEAGYAVTGLDSDAASLAALAATGRVSAQTLDLFHSPPSAEWLAGMDLVVFDPPRAGAAELATHLAQTATLPAPFAPPRAIIAVSCNPATFARDARILTDGGWRLTALTPVDQFAWTPHLELVAQFAPPPRPNASGR